MHEFVSRRVDVGETVLEVLEAGEGPPVFACTHPYLDTTGPRPAGGLSEALAGAGRTVYLVPRGTGNSDPETRSEKLGMHQTVDDLEAARRALGVERWVVAGTSTGGMTAIEYTLRYPGSVSGLVAIGAAASWRFLEDPDCIYNPAHPEAWREEEARSRLDGSEEAGKRWIRTVLELSLQRKELVDVLAGRTSNISAPRLARIREELIGSWDREQEISSIGVPTLVACGRYDSQCPIRSSLLMAERIPDATLVVFEGSNHFPYEEEPEAFRQAILEFAEKVRLS